MCNRTQPPTTTTTTTTTTPMTTLTSTPVCPALPFHFSLALALVRALRRSSRPTDSAHWSQTGRSEDAIGASTTKGTREAEQTAVCGGASATKTSPLLPPACLALDADRGRSIMTICLVLLLYYIVGSGGLAPAPVPACGYHSLFSTCSAKTSADPVQKSNTESELTTSKMAPARDPRSRGRQNRQGGESNKRRRRRQQQLLLLPPNEKGGLGPLRGLKAGAENEQWPPRGPCGLGAPDGGPGADPKWPLEPPLVFPVRPAAPLPLRVPPVRPVRLGGPSTRPPLVSGSAST